MRESSHHNVKRLGDVLETFIQTAKKQRSKHSASIAEMWPTIVGKPFDRYSSVMGTRNGVLIVQVDSSTVRHELDVMRKHEILTRIRTLFPTTTVSNIKYTLK